MYRRNKKWYESQRTLDHVKNGRKMYDKNQEESIQKTDHESQSWNPDKIQLDVSIQNLLRLEKEEESEKWKKLHIGWLDGTSCQHLQVMMTNVIQKQWEWQEERKFRDETRDGDKTNTVHD